MFNNFKSKRDLILNLLEKHDFNIHKVYEYYDDLYDKQIIVWKKANFQREVRRIKEEVEKKKGVKTNNKVIINEDVIKSLSKEQEIKFKKIIDSLGEDFSIDDLLNLKSDNINYKSKIEKLNTEIKYLHAKNFKFNEIVSQIKEHVNQVQPDNFTFNVNINILKSVKNRLNNILLLSDIHYGDVVIPEHINYVNEYNTNIAKNRIIKLFEENLKMAKYTGSDVLYIMMLGDLLSGIIHDEIVENNEKPITKLLIELYNFLSTLLSQYKSQFDKIIINCVVGNHGRLEQDVSYKNKAQNNFEYILYYLLQEKFLKDDKIQINVSESPKMFVNIDNLVALITHGDDYKGGNNFLGIPAQTVSRDSFREKMLFSEIDKKYDLMCLAHFHRKGIVYQMNQPIIFNPSVIGPCEYGLNTCHDGTDPSQYSLICDEKEIKYIRLINLK